MLHTLIDAHGQTLGTADLPVVAVVGDYIHWQDRMLRVYERHVSEDGVRLIVGGGARGGEDAGQ